MGRWGNLGVICDKVGAIWDRVGGGIIILLCLALWVFVAWRYVPTYGFFGGR